jgi:hypothetical protein
MRHRVTFREIDRRHICPSSLRKAVALAAVAVARNMFLVSPLRLGPKAV